MRTEATLGVAGDVLAAAWIRGGRAADAAVAASACSGTTPPASIDEGHRRAAG